MIRVYNYMASGGVAITVTCVAYAVYAMSVVTGADGTITGLTLSSRQPDVCRCF